MYCERRSGESLRGRGGRKGREPGVRGANEVQVRGGGSGDAFMRLLQRGGERGGKK